jgi:predicted transposase YbfD/YdcC
VSGRRDLNPRPHRPERCALAKLRHAPNRQDYRTTSPECQLFSAGRLEAYFGNIEDPRRTYLNDHPLINIITIALCGVIAGAEGWSDIELFGQQKKEWLSRFLDLKNGIPSHDTFGRVFARLDPEQFRESFLSWVQAVFEVTGGQVIAIDGKELRRSHDKGLGKRAIRMISAWATANRIVLGQRKVGHRSSEVTAIPKLLKLLDISGCIVTIDPSPFVSGDTMAAHGTIARWWAAPCI